MIFIMTSPWMVIATFLMTSRGKVVTTAWPYSMWQSSGDLANAKFFPKLGECSGAG